MAGELRTVKQIAAELNVSESTARRRIKSGAVPATRDINRGSSPWRLDRKAIESMRDRRN